MSQERATNVAAANNEAANKTKIVHFTSLYTRLDAALTDGAHGNSSGPSEDDVTELLAAYKALKQIEKVMPRAIKNDIWKLIIVARENELGISNEDCSQMNQVALIKYMDGLDAVECFRIKQKPLLDYSLFGPNLMKDKQKIVQELLKLVSTMLESGVNLTDCEIPQNTLGAMNKEFERLKEEEPQRVEDKLSELKQALEAIAESGAGWVADARQADFASPEKDLDSSSDFIDGAGRVVQSEEGRTNIEFSAYVDPASPPALGEVRYLDLDPS